MTRSATVAARAVWSDGKPLSAGWAKSGRTDGSTTKGRGSERSPAASWIRAVTTTTARTACTASPTFSGRESVSQIAAAATGTRIGKSWATVEMRVSIRRQADSRTWESAGYRRAPPRRGPGSVSYTHLRAHETRHDVVCRL